eukprot:7437859-Pyramimonas_sp.AAC.1
MSSPMVGHNAISMMACHRPWIWDMPRGPQELHGTPAAGAVSYLTARPPKTGLHWPRGSPSYARRPHHTSSSTPPSPNILRVNHFGSKRDFAFAL